MGLITDLRDIVKHENYSTNSLGAAIGVDQSSLAKWLRGERSISSDAIEKLFDYLGLELKKKISYAEWRDEQWQPGYSDYEHVSELYEEKKAEEWKEYSESKEFYDEFRERLDRDKEIDSDKESDLFNQFSQDSYEDWSCNYDEEYRADYFDESFEELNNGQWPDCLRDEAEQYPVEVEIDWEGVGDDWAKENANV